MPFFNRNLFHLNQIIKSEESTRLMREIIDVCGFTKCEAKMTLNAFQLFAKVMHQTREEEHRLRIRLLRGELDYIGFKYRELKSNPNNHVMIRFFNGLVNFKCGHEEAFGDLVECVVIDEGQRRFDFA